MNDYTLPTLPTQDVGSHTGEEEDNETVQTWWGRLVSIKKSQEGALRGTPLDFQAHSPNCIHIR